MADCSDLAFKSFCDLANFVKHTEKVEFVVAILALLMNIPHLFILTRTSMRTHSTNSLMIGISIADLISLFMMINNRAQLYWLSPNTCFNSYTYPLNVARFVQDVSWESMMRVSFYLGLCLALIRCIIMKMSGNAPDILSTTRNGYFLTLFFIFVNTLISCFYYYGFRVIKYKEPWTPGVNCTGFPAKYREPYFYRAPKKNQLFTSERYEIFTGCSDILIAALYPIFGLLLMLEVLKSAKVAATMLSKKDAVERYHTSRMILVMTIFYIFASFPTGAYKIVNFFFYESWRKDGYFYVVFTYTGKIFTSLFCGNALSHCLINLSMSRNYRNAVMELGCCPKRKAEVTMDSKSVNS
ncbi:G-protein coupled receptors family 1 profile domain-containing protein [Caenorhabditis elegans]|uniref:G-protein coupled receptors family 1 profile domain-containing protein n=1 Tax=Caenorhabditis elegans TaxID=6239 RepID=Q9XTR5_CAEEL|nr:G-protein coupled receptors family 1 profile domain-containing protein [Caenorhabditis elegans]CAB16549.4 G-protein coupled receptors family 1 profile domain-containing protein [Caenorhabditis elegans]|eukprot:NP_001346696.1 Serpentine Receptor, class W [Caenorhabditis elegans]